MGRNRLILVRHGTTTAGMHVFLDSRSDPRLSPEGVRQARLLRNRLQAARTAAVVVSPMQRALETAALAAPSCTVQIDERIREVDHGLFTGLSVAEVERRYPRELEAWRMGVSCPPGGEPLASLMERVVSAALDAVTGLSPHGDALFFTHSGPIRALLTAARGRERAEWQRQKVPHGALRTVTITPVVLARWEAIVQGTAA